MPQSKALSTIPRMRGGTHLPPEDVDGDALPRVVVGTENLSKALHRVQSIVCVDFSLGCHPGDPVSGKLLLTIAKSGNWCREGKEA